MKISFGCNMQNFRNDFEEVFRAFGGFFEFDKEGKPFIVEILNNDEISICFEGKCSKKQLNLELFTGSCAKTSEIKIAVKAMIYDILSDISKIRLPYGSLTGIRPTKLYYNFERIGFDARKRLIDVCRVSPQKADLIREVVTVQHPLRNIADNESSVFINIPVCIGRCVYCSFISAEYSRVERLLPEYVSRVLAELEKVKTTILERGILIRSVYIGGGTPTALPQDLFLEIVKAAAEFQAKEYTVEAGRPDSITLEKLEIMAKYGVTRISINPQTFNDKTLEAIGRRHSVADIFDAVKLARRYDFAINMDLIAMLPGESFEDFSYSLERTIELAPENITVHTLSVKAGSLLKLAGTTASNAVLAEEMTSHAYERLRSAGYEPYYLYRQKYMGGSLENIGYARDKKLCVYNVDMMEELTPIFGIGAGAISKSFEKTGDTVKITRKGNPKGFHCYLNR